MDMKFKSVVVDTVQTVEDRLEHMDKLISTLIDVSEKNLYTGYFVEIPSLLKMQITQTRKEVNAILKEFEPN